MFSYFIRTCLFILCSVTADPLLLEMKVEQLELRLRQVEEAQTALLARLEQYESREARGEHQETYNHQCTPWSLDYEPLTDTTGFYSTRQPWVRLASLPTALIPQGDSLGVSLARFIPQGNSPGASLVPQVNSLGVCLLSLVTRPQRKKVSYQLCLLRK